MDPVSLILAALASGASAAAKETAGTAIKEAYAGIKTLIKKRFAGKPVAETTMSEYEGDPKTWEAPMRKQLDEANLGDDKEVIDAVNELIELLQAEGISVVASGDRSIAIGGDASGSTIVTGDQNTVGAPSSNERPTLKGRRRVREAAFRSTCSRVFASS